LFTFCLPIVHRRTDGAALAQFGGGTGETVLGPRAAALYRVSAVGPWRYGVTLLPGASRPDDERDEGKVDEVLRARSENGWELVNAVTERDGSDLLVFRRLAD